LIQNTVKGSLSLLSQVTLSYLFYVLCHNSTIDNRQSARLLRQPVSSFDSRRSEAKTSLNSIRESECVTIDGDGDTAEDFYDEDLTREERSLQQAIIRNLM
jgi:hypothetical protein